MKRLPIYLVTILSPLVLAYIELGHPSGFKNNVYDFMLPMADYWRNLHIAQSFLFAFVALGAYFMTKPLTPFFKIASRMILGLFLVTYVVFDSVGGISVGVLLAASKTIPNLDVYTTKELIQKLYNDPVVGGTQSVFSLTGSWSWLIAILIITAGLFYRYKSELSAWRLSVPMILLPISAYSLYVSHTDPYGPIAFTCFACANIWMEIFWRNLSPTDGS